jgi:cell division protein FtsB
MDSVDPDPGDPADPGVDGSPPEPDPGADVEAEADATGAALVNPEATTTVMSAPVHLDTAAAVDTEAVEPPPVQIATVDRPDGPRKVSGRAAAIVVLVAIALIGVAAYLGYSLNQDLGSTRSTLASTQDDLESTDATLDETTADLATTTKSLADATAQRTDLDSQINELSGQVATQTECVTLQKAALLELVRISLLQTENFNRTTEGSSWDKAEKKRAGNITTALDQFYEAYSAAFKGSSGTAKAHSDKGKAAQTKIAEAEAQQVAELKVVDTKAAEIQAAIDALQEQLTTTETTCAGVAP